MDGMDDKTLLRKTLLTVAAMVGACVFVVGSLSLVALLVVGRATSTSKGDDGAGQIDRSQVHGTPSPTPVNGATPAQDPASRPTLKSVPKPNQI
jgi:hypothetical protein